MLESRDTAIVAHKAAPETGPHDVLAAIGGLQQLGDTFRTGETRIALRPVVCRHAGPIEKLAAADAVIEEAELGGQRKLFHNAHIVDGMRVAYHGNVLTVPT